MTTIATDGETLAADSRITEGNYIFTDEAEKVFKVGDTYVAICGEYQSGLAYVDWLKKERSSEKPTVSEDNFSAILVTSDGVFCVDNMLIPMKVSLPYAMGSGGPVALGAMLAGCSPAEAINIALQVDASSGGEVQEYDLEFE